MSKTIRNIAIIIALCLLGYLIYLFSIFTFIPQKHIIKDSTVVLEKITKVMKLVTVEGQFSEIHKHEEFYAYNISPFRKKALIRVNAKVMVGYDLDKLNLEIDEAARTVSIEEFPPAELLSVDDEVEYYDITEGMFTSFSKEDYTAIQKEAESIIRRSVDESDLFKKSNEQREDMISMLKLTLNSIGWDLKIKSQNPILD